MLLLILTALLLALAGAAKAAVDLLTHQPDNNIFADRGSWYDARTSWKRKYKNYDAGDLRPAYPGATGWLVLFTDFWHLADSVYLTAYYLGAVCLGAYAASRGITLAGVAILAAGRVLFAAVFELFYQKVFRKQSATSKK